MPLDNKESNAVAASAVEASGREKQPQPAKEVPPTPERSGLESGDVIEAGRITGGNERVYRSDMLPPQATYSPSTDPAYQAYKQIEGILAEDLGEIYNNLTPREQKAFKIKGEETARSIFQLVYHKTKIKVKKIIKLIRSWLRAVPGINKFFLEQEAKIKADKIVALAQKDKKIQF